MIMISMLGPFILQRANTSFFPLSLPLSQFSIEIEDRFRKTVFRQLDDVRALFSLPFFHQFLFLFLDHACFLYSSHTIFLFAPSHSLSLSLSLFVSLSNSKTSSKGSKALRFVSRHDWFYGLSHSICSRH